mmetsp:Transcript_19750/g.45951  ORF Transcript_19750/g.45951 Transcript_19750/m.45951 type:complete len:302 (+) Transcript_19750:86-991(+)
MSQAWGGGHQQRRPNQNARLSVLPDPSDLGAMAVRGVTWFARRNKILTGSYVFGLLVLVFFASGGTRLSLQQRHAFNQIMDTIDVHAEVEASNRYSNAYHVYQNSKGWFWTCDSLCQRNKHRMELAKADLDAIRKEGNARMSDAKAVAGLFSEVGVDEAKESFWSYFSSGTEFAKRQSMWDAMFMGIRSMSRDETMVEYILKVLFQVLLNFSLGLIIALVVFVIGLWNLISNYQPNPIVAVVFFLCAALGAFAFVTTYLLGLYGAVAGGLYGVAKLAETNARARLQEQQRQAYMYNRPHYQ